MEFMTVDYMSSEHSMSESEGEQRDENGYESPDLEEREKKKVFSVSKLEWRSPALTQVMQSLDRKNITTTKFKRSQYACGKASHWHYLKPPCS